jgi:hypothetical protein
MLINKPYGVGIMYAAQLPYIMLHPPGTRARLGVDRGSYRAESRISPGYLSHIAFTTPDLEPQPAPLSQPGEFIVLRIETTSPQKKLRLSP